MVGVETSGQDGKVALYVSLFLLTIYVLTSPGTMQSIDEKIMFEATQSLAHGHLDIDDPAGVVGRFGLHYSKYGIGLPMLSLPFWLIGSIVGKLLPPEVASFAARFMVAMVNPFLTALTGGLLYLFGLHLFNDRRTALLTALAFGIGTLAWPYTQTFFSEPATALSVLLAFYFLMRLDQTGHPIDAWLAGVSLGVALLIRPAAIITGVGVVVYLAFIVRGSRKAGDVVRFSVAVTVAVAVICLYNWLRFGNMLAFGYGEEGFSNPLINGLYGFLLSPGKSMFLYSPILLLSIPGLILLAKKDKALALSVSVTVTVTILFYSMWAGWDGWFWGPRYILSVLPLLAIACGAFLAYSKDTMRLLFVLLIAVSIGVQLYALPVSAQRMYYRLYVSGDPDYMQKTQFDWRHSPLIEQSKDIKAVCGNLGDTTRLRSIVRQRDVSEARGQKYYFEHNINYQAPNFWWAYLYILGFPSFLITAALIMLLSIAAALAARLHRIGAWNE